MNPKTVQQIALERYERARRAYVRDNLGLTRAKPTERDRDAEDAFEDAIGAGLEIAAMVAVEAAFEGASADTLTDIFEGLGGAFSGGGADDSW